MNETENREWIKQEFEITDTDLGNAEILFAHYETGNYEGQAIVLFKDDEKYFVVEGSHCSCYGLEGQWHPIETTEEALKLEIEGKSTWFFSDFREYIEFCKIYFGWE
jgi:hypothetical protein